MHVSVRPADPSVPTTAPRSERPLLAILLRLAAAAALTLTFAIAKWLGERGVGLVEMVAWRQILALPIVYVWLAMTLGPLGFRTTRFGGHARRAVVGLIGMAFNFGAVLLLPLAESTTIGFMAPIFATMLSALLLREATGIHRWGAVLLGFVGVIVMARPDTMHFPPLGLAVAIGGAVLTAIVAILLRHLSSSEPAPSIVFWYTLLSVPPGLLGLALFGSAHDNATWLLIIAMGITGGAAQLLLTAALQYGPVSLVVPMDYSAILWATLLGWLMWGALPITSTWIGAALIAGSGLYIVWREHVRGNLSRWKRLSALE